MATRPDQLKQLERLAAEEKEYVAALKARQTPASPPSTSAAAPSAPRSLGMTPSAADDDDDYSSDVTVPEQITDRMLSRMLIFSGGPVAFGILLFPLFYYLKKVADLDVPVWAVYLVQTTIFGGGLLGISYGVISTSWDPKREGSKLGWNEFQANLPLVLDRFRRKD